MDREHLSNSVTKDCATKMLERYIVTILAWALFIFIVSVIRKRLFTWRKNIKYHEVELRYNVLNQLGAISQMWVAILVLLWIVTGEFRLNDVIVIAIATISSLSVAAFIVRDSGINPASSFASLLRTFAEVFEVNSSRLWLKVIIGASVLPISLVLIIVWVMLSEIISGTVEYSDFVTLLSVLSLLTWCLQVIALLPLALHPGLNHDARLHVTVSQAALGTVPIILAFISAQTSYEMSLGPKIDFTQMPMWGIVVIFIVLILTIIPLLIGNWRRRTGIFSGLDGIEHVVRLIDRTLSENSFLSDEVQRRRVIDECQNIAKEVRDLATPADRVRDLLRRLSDEENDMLDIRRLNPDDRNKIIGIIKSGLEDFLEQLKQESFHESHFGRGIKARISRTPILTESGRNDILISAVQVSIEQQIEILVADFVELVLTALDESIKRDTWTTVSGWNHYVVSTIDYIDEFDAILGRLTKVIDAFPWTKYVPRFIRIAARILQYFGIAPTRNELEYYKNVFVARRKSYIRLATRAPLEDPRWKRVINANKLQEITGNAEVELIRSSIREIGNECELDRNLVLNEKSHWGQFALPTLACLIPLLLDVLFFRNPS